MKCPNGHELGDVEPKNVYVGLYCIYCSEPVASIENADGQLTLRQHATNRLQKYLGVIYQEKQTEVTDIQVVTDHVEISFANGDRKDDLKTHEVLLAFQEPEETLAID